MRRAWIVVCLVLLTVGAAEARRRARAPIRIRMAAFVGEKVEGTRPDFEWVATYKGKRYRLFVLNLQVLGGGVTPLDIDAAVRPYSVQFAVTGDKAKVARLIDAPPRQQLVITGYLRLDASGRYLMLDTVEIGPGAPTTPGSE
ncbi:MAG TPA: hypothetical protein VMW17_01780 [Candidatus Binatia bacterium]|nr:hypothetical protein [Candidatus Binatia bacterium]